MAALIFRGCLFLAALLVVTIAPTHSALSQGFGKFGQEPINAPGDYALVRDPTGMAPEPQVHLFKINAGTCSSKPYGNGLNDCHFQSVRNQLFEKKRTQPREAWYSWSMYFPAGFALGRNQKAGGTYSFAYWHNLECPNVDLGIAEGSNRLFLQTNIYAGPGNCTPDQRIDLGSLQPRIGAWQRVEMHVLWSNGKEGIVEVYLNGALTGTLRGRNITAGAPKDNYFKFGLYLHGTRDTKKVTPVQLMFTTPTRTKSRTQ